MSTALQLDLQREAQFQRFLVYTFLEYLRMSMYLIVTSKTSNSDYLLSFVLHIKWVPFSQFVLHIPIAAYMAHHLQVTVSKAAKNVYFS